MTRMHPNQSLDTLISLTVLNSIWQFANFPHIWAVWKTTKLLDKNLSFKLASSMPMPPIGTFHSTNLLLRFDSLWGLRIFSLSHTCDKTKKTSFSNLFLFSHHHIPTNSIAPLSEYKHTHNPQILRSLWQRANTQRSALKLFTVANYVINSVDNTKLPCYTLPLMQHQSFFRNLPPLLWWIWSLD